MHERKGINYLRGRLSAEVRMSNEGAFQTLRVPASTAIVTKSAAVDVIAAT